MLDAWGLVRRLAVGALALTISAHARAEDLPDRWAPGASEPVWRAIARLQAYPDFSPEPLNWPRALAHPNPLLRVAAAAALGRAPGPGSLKHVETLLGDPSRAVQRTALWALLQRPGDDVQPVARRVLETWPFLDDAGGNDGSLGEPPIRFGRLLDTIGLPGGLATRSLIERRGWLAALSPGQWRVRPVPGGPGHGGGVRFQLATAESEIDAGQELRLSVSWQPVDPLPTRSLHSPSIFLSLEEASWVEVWPDGRTAHGLVEPRLRPRLRTLRGARFIHAAAPGSEEVALTLDAGLDPGLYALSLAASNPVLVRLRRAAATELAIPRLLEAAGSDVEAVERLGRLRVRVAAPALAAEWRRYASAPGQWSRRDAGLPASERGRPLALISALARLDDPEGLTAIAPFILSGGSLALARDSIWVAYGLIPALGRAAPDYAEAMLLSWRQRLAAGQAWSLGIVPQWPGFEAGSRFALEVEELGQALVKAPASLQGREWALAGTLRGLARVAPPRGALLLADELRRRDVDTMVLNLLTAPTWSLPEPNLREMSALAWLAIRDDPRIDAEHKARLALIAIRAGGAEWLESAGPVPAAALAWWLGVAQPWPYPPPPDWPGRVELTREELRRRPDANLELALADVLRSAGDSAAARELVLAALPRLKDPARKAHAQVVLGLLHLILGDASAARRALEEARRLPGLGQDPGGQSALEAAIANLDTRPRFAGLRVRYDYQPLGRPLVRSGPARFWIDDIGRVLRIPRGGAPPELLGLALGRVVSAQALDAERLAVALADGSVALYAAGTSGARWAVAGFGAQPVLAVSREAVVVEGPPGVDVLDARDGSLLRRHPKAHVSCGAALPPLAELVAPRPWPNGGWTLPRACLTGQRDRPVSVSAGSISVVLSRDPRIRHQISLHRSSGEVVHAEAPADPRPRGGTALAAEAIPGGLAVDLGGGLEEVWEVVPEKGAQSGLPQSRDH